MNKLIYETNMAALEKKYPVWAEILRSNRRKQRNMEVSVEQSYSNEMIMKVCQKEKTLYLNGKYAPDQVVEEWFEQQGEIDKFACIIIIGISNGVHIKKIMERVPKSVNILIYEPSYEIFRRAMEEVDLSFIFKLNIPVGIIVQKINGFEMERYFRYMINYDNLISLKIYFSGNYKKLFKKEIEDFLKLLNVYLSSIEVSWNTIVRYTDVNAKNIFSNMKYLFEGYSVADLKGILPKDVPAIIVSAGPSLNKNLNDLRAAVGKACIIATDTAMKPLLNAGIIPDMFVIVDGLKPAFLFDHPDISKCAMVTMTGVSVEPMQMHKGKKFFYYNESVYENKLIRIIDGMEERKVCLPDLPSGGSVATSAYSLGVYMGAKTVILVGQDLALTGNKVHVDGAFEDEKFEIDDSGAYFEVDAVDGGKVITRADFKLYLDWFERTIKNWKNITTIDATEGGALIHGAKNMTLKKAIKKYCIKEYNVKWHVARMHKIFDTEEERRAGLTYFKNTIEKLNRVKEKAEEGLRYYHKLKNITAKQSIDIHQLQKIYKKIKKINLFMEEDTMAETVSDSLKGIESTLRPTIYKVQENQQDEMQDIIQQGELMLTAISYGTDEIKEIVEQTIVPYANEQWKYL